MNYAIQQRLRMIDFLLAQYGNVGRTELMSYYGIGSACATRDFALYDSKHPGNALFNQVSKRWVRSDTFQPQY